MQPEETGSTNYDAPDLPPETEAIDTDDSAGTDEDGYTQRMRRAVHRIAWSMVDTPQRPAPITRGERSALRPMQDGQPDGLVFWKLAARYLHPEKLLLDDDHPRRLAVEHAWAAVLAAAARLNGQHRRNWHLGRALAEAKVSEARFQRLYAAHGTALLDALRGSVHQLASSGVLVDLGDIAELLLSDGSEIGLGDSRWQDDVRHRMALEFYRHHKD